MEGSRRINTIICTAKAQNIPREKSRIEGSTVAADGDSVHGTYETGDQTSAEGSRRADHDDVADSTTGMFTTVD